MSSLLQHHGGRSADGRKVELLFCPVVKGKDWERYNGPGSYRPSPDSTTFCDDAETFQHDGKTYAQLYRAFRRPAGMMGCWATFRYNGRVQVPDLSVPISILRLPRDAKPLTRAECIAYWQS